MQINRGLVFWGVALITAGAMALAIQAGIIDRDRARELWRFWPVVLIAIGLAVIAARTPFATVGTLVAGLAVGALAGTLVTGWPAFNVGCGGGTDTVVGRDGSFGDAAEVELDLDCGELAVTTARGSDWTVDARYAGGAEPQLTASDDSLRVATREDGPFGLGDRRQAWDVTLPTDSDLDLSIDANAAESHLHLDDATLTSFQLDANAGSADIGLAGASVGELEVDANAGSVSIVADDATTLDGAVEINAGSLELCAPESALVAITLEDGNITFSHNLEDSGLTRQGDTWSNGEGEPAIRLNVSGSAASFNFNPEDGCS